MKHILCFLTGLCCLFPSQKPVHALEPFVPISSAPLTVTSSYPGWSEQGVMQANVRHEDNIYRMWYTSVSGDLRLAYATSPDGMSWQGHQLYDIIPGQNTHDPSVIKSDDRYVMYFATTPEGGLTRIMQISSPDGVVFNQETLHTVLEPVENYERRGVSSPAVYEENGNRYIFYSSLDDRWEMHLAVQTGDTISRCGPTAIASNDAVPKSVIKYNSKYYLFFHSSDGMEYMESDSLACGASWTNRSPIYPSSFFPSALIGGNRLLLYYGKMADGTWKLFVASSPVANSSKNPVILIPGMFASWNSDAMLHNLEVSQTQWKLNPVVQEYTGLMHTLENLGYTIDEDCFVFAYDWRKNIEDIADDLKIYIDSLPSGAKPHLVGHSLGGLVARVYADKYGAQNYSKIITAGTPHKGTAKVYSLVQAGEIESDKSLMWLAQNLLIQLNRDGLQTNRQIVQRHFPVAQNLLPVSSYLRMNNKDIPTDDMHITNNLISLHQNIPPQIISVAGNKGNTLAGYEVEKQTLLDRLLDYYPDGRPKSSVNQAGDYTVTVKSASFGDDPITISKDHGELIYTSEGIRAILDSLAIPFEDNQIVAGKKTILTPSLIFLMRSPARLTVSDSNRTYADNEGMILIEDAQSGNYLLTAHAKGTGRYQILIGQLGSDGYVWQTIDGNLTSSDQTDEYSFSFDAGKPLPQAVGGENELALLAADLQISFPKKQYYAFQIQVLTAIRKSSDQTRLASLFHLLDKTELMAADIRSMIPRAYLTNRNQIAALERELIEQEKKLLKARSDGVNIEKALLLVRAADEKLKLIRRLDYTDNAGYIGTLVISVNNLLAQVR